MVTFLGNRFFNGKMHRHRGASLVAQVVRNLPAMQATPGLERFPGARNDNPFQHSCLGNSMDRGAWWAVVHGVTGSQT